MEFKSTQIKIYNYTYTIEFKTNDEIQRAVAEFLYKQGQGDKDEGN